MEVRSEVAGGVAVYRIAGKLDALTKQDLESAVAFAIDGGTARIIFDMRDVTFITSAGLRVIVMTAKQAAAAKGGLAVFGAQSAVQEVFEVSGLHTIVPIVADETQARAKLAG